MFAVYMSGTVTLSLFPINLVGTPAAMTQGGISLVTIDPGQTTAPSPTVTPGSTTQLAPKTESFSKTTWSEKNDLYRQGIIGPLIRLPSLWISECP